MFLLIHLKHPLPQVDHIIWDITEFVVSCVLATRPPHAFKLNTVWKKKNNHHKRYEKGRVSSYLPSEGRAAAVQPIRERPVFHELVHEDDLVHAVAQQPHKTLVVEFGEKLELRRKGVPHMAAFAGVREVTPSRLLDGRHRPVRKNAFVHQSVCTPAKLRRGAPIVRCSGELLLRVFDQRPACLAAPPSGVGSQRPPSALHSPAWSIAIPPHIHRYMSKPCLPLKNAQSQLYSQLHNLCKPHQAQIKSFYILIYGLGILLHTLSCVKERKYITLPIYTPVRDMMFEIQRMCICIEGHPICVLNFDSIKGFNHVGMYGINRSWHDWFKKESM